MLQFLDVPRSSQPRAPRSRLRPPYPVKLPVADDCVAARIVVMAVNHFLNVLQMSADHQGRFKTVITVQIDGESKPLLIAGTAHGAVEDGSCIAVLNPERELVDKLSGCWGAHPPIFKEVIAMKCDVGVSLWIDAYKPNGVVEITRYVAKQPCPARFVV